MGLGFRVLGLGFRDLGRTSRTLNYGNSGIFLIMGKAGFRSSTVRANSPWFLVGKGGWGFWDYYRGPQGAIIGIHSPHSLLRSRENSRD